MLKEALENVLPYISNISEVKKFVNENEGKNMEEIRKLLEEAIESSQGTLKTDFKILFNELEKIINKSV